MSSHPTVRWGILATGRIAHTFARDLALVEDNTLVAAGSRSATSARAFTAEHGGTPHDSYEALAADPDVDVVYVASPHGRHHDDVLMCLEHGKAVLCEKALTLDLASSTELVRVARDRSLFLAEAMWMRVNPNVRRIVELAGNGTLGTVAQLRAELGFVAGPEVTRLWDPALGASALLDLGIYPLTFAHAVLGEPDRISAAGTWHDDGFDTGGGATLVYPGGAVASIAWTQLAWTDNLASVSGDEGRIEVPSRFHHPTEFTVINGDTRRVVAEPVVGRGYAHEVMEVARCLREGRTESTLLPLEGTLSVMAQMDEIRRQIAAGGPSA
ncbi:Gfo/Idh/MocA family protein [Aeromicrobium sp. CF4.19]|uniref:Gfo/Idh/MocA family protein n=1 Tax=Aeromicrobium sp. CF4.19 TaxID=3373082 RepID=UPI003EE7B25F